MTQTRFRVSHTSTKTSTTKDITSLINLNDSEGIKANADIFSFRVKYDSSTQNTFDVDDRIQIWIWDSNETQPTNPIMDGIVTNFKIDSDTRKKLWTVNGMNRLERLLNVPVSVSFGSSDVDRYSPRAIINIVNRVNDARGNRGSAKLITAALRSANASNTIDDTAYRGGTSTVSTNFKDISPYAKRDTSAFEIIEELSMPQFTGDNQVYVFYLNQTNAFVWERKSTTPASSVLEEGVNILEYQVEKNVYNVINYVIINAGPDFDGNIIQNFGRNAISETRYGRKGKFFTMHWISNSLRRGTATSAPYGTAAASGFASNDAFRTAVKAKARDVADKIAETLGNPRFKAKIKVRGTRSYSKGALHTVRITNVFVNPKLERTNELQLRLTEIEQELTKNGWTTTLNFEQDELAIVGNI